MEYKEFKKILLDLDITVADFSRLFELNQGSIANMKTKGKVSKMVRSYILILQGIGVEKMKELMNNK